MIKNIDTIKLKNFFLGNFKKSILFFLPYLLVSVVIFCICYFTNWYTSWGVVDGYGWSNNILLNNFFGWINISVDKKFYPYIFGLFYFFISVPIQEFVFRVIFLQFIKNKYQFVIINSIVFTLIHIYYMKPLALIMVFIMSILISLDYFKNRSFTTICLFHFLMASFAFTLNLA